MKLMKLMSMALCLGLLACVQSSALAGERKRAERGERADLDGDGKIDHHELKLALEAELGALDKDHDGKTGLKEGRETLAALKEKLDTDKDGKLDHGEIRAELKKIKEHHPELFERIMHRLREHHEKK